MRQNRKQKGFLAFGMMKYVILIAGLMVIMGGTLVKVADDTAMCTIDGRCEDLQVTLGKIVIDPQENIADSVYELKQGIADGTMTEVYANYLKQGIFLSLLITIVEFVFFFWLGTKLLTTMNWGDYIGAFIFAVGAIAVSHLLLTHFIMGGMTVPFRGWYALATNWNILFTVINYSEVLPLNATLNTSV